MISRIRALAAIATAVALLSLGLASQAFGAAPAWQPVAMTGPTYLPPLQSEIQTVFVDAEGGTYTLKFGAATTAPIAFDATAAQVESALNALSTIGGAGGSVSVVGGPGGKGAKDPYAVTFGGSLADTNVAEMTRGSSALTGGDTTSATIASTLNGGPGTTNLLLMVQNIGGFESGGVLTYKAKLPAGVTTTGTPTGDTSKPNPWTCSTGAGQVEVTCTWPNAQLPPSAVAPAINVPITSAPGAQSGMIEMEVSGAGGMPKTNTLPLTISSTPAPPGIQSFVAGAYDSNGNSDTRAGAHPYSANTAIFANTRISQMGKVVVSGEVKNIVVDLPPGFLGNPIAVPQCPESVEEANCPLNTMVGLAQPITAPTTAFGPFPVFNTEAPYGAPAKFRFNILGLVPLNAIGSLRSDEDYGITVGSFNTPQIAMVFGTFFTFWGTPADASHDSLRCRNIPLTGGAPQGCEASDAPKTAFLTSASDCALQAESTPITFLHMNSWQEPDIYSDLSVAIPPVAGCDELDFQADFKFEPSDTTADSPASFRTELTVPSEGLTNPKKRTQPQIKDTVVKLPEGVSLNPAGAEGLEACTEQQIGFLGGGFPMPNPMRFSKDAQTCPEASKIGTGELKSELLDEPLHGDLYLAAQGDGNPFGSLFAVYLVIEDPRHGIFIKLPGEVETDKQNGQFQVSFRNLPQLPFSYLRLSLKGGSHSALASPTTCGSFATTATSTPWSAPESGPPYDSSNTFEINKGPNGQPCSATKADRPFNLGFVAGTDSVAAAAHSPLTFQINRPDGSQELNTLDLRTAPGISAKLRGIPQCADGAVAAAQAKTGKQEQANPSCPADTQIGRIVTAAGAGPTPFYTDGKLFLAGPYKGAPLSVVAITPAVAGPFDLGNVVVRTAVQINRSTAQVTAATDPIPQILEGVPLRIKEVRVILDRSNFSLNPTSCDPGAITLNATGNSGATVERSTRFQVGGCQNLAFKPSLRAHLTGGTKRGKHPAFTAEVSFPAGHANTKDVQVTIPHSEFLDQAHINTICTRVQAAAKQCPAGSIYGYAEAETPLIDGKLTGPVFLKSSNHQLPDLAIALRGPDSQPVEVEFAGRIDSIKGQIRNTIEGLPDVPVSNFVLRMKGGRKGLLVNSRDLCKSRVTKMTVRMVGQNNKTTKSRPPLTRDCKGKGKKSKRAKARANRATGNGWSQGWIARFVEGL